MSLRNCLHNKKEREMAMVSSLLEEEKIKNSRVISVFVSFGSEIDTLELISVLLNAGKRVVVPFIKKDDSMVMKEITSLGDLSFTNKYAIKEPNGDAKEINKEEIDVMLVPGLAFDNNNYRLGYGKGYYDKYLMGSSIFTIGIGYKEQLVDSLPTDDFDVSLSEIRLF